jgi:hypothetical protein
MEVLKLKSIDKPKIKKLPLEVIMDKFPENVENIILDFLDIKRM